MKTPPHFPGIDLSAMRSPIWMGFILATLCTSGLPATSIIQFTTTTYALGESEEAVALRLNRQEGLGTEVSVAYTTRDMAAIAGVDYFTSSGTCVFAPDQTHQTLVVPVLNDGFVEGTETFQVILSNPTGEAILGASSTATVSIADNDVGTQFQFASYNISEDADSVLIGVVRGDDGILPVSVDFATTDVTAVNGVDYTGMATTLEFAGNERLKLVPVVVLNDALKETLNKTFRATLSNPVGVTLGNRTTATVTIEDNDQGFQFESVTNNVVEDAGVALVRILRGTDRSDPIVSVDFATTDLSANSGLDYAHTTCTLTFSAGEGAKLVRVPILNDGVKESSEDFRATLSDPSEGAVIGPESITTISISDNDPGIGFELSRPTTAWENSGAVSLRVLRGNDYALGPITVEYASSDGTAKAGEDYQPVSGTLHFERNETIKSLAITLHPDQQAEQTESFGVTLSNPSGGAALGTSSTSVEILDATGWGTYATVAPPYDTELGIRREGGVNVLSWAGGGQLQRADTPMGPWQMLAGTRSPHRIDSPAPTTLYRVTLPRPASLYIPSSYDAQSPIPLVILLHGYGWSGADTEDYVQLRPLAEARGFLYCVPEGTIDRWGNPFWNGTDACDDFEGTGIDDAGYLRALILEIERQFAVDAKQVYLVGGSNGGCLAFAVACQSADLVAAVASLAGPTFLDTTRCLPSQRVNILYIQGTADEGGYAGGAEVSPPFPANMPAYPGALQTVRTWAEYNGANVPEPDSEPSMDLDLAVPGLDTVILRYMDAQPGGDVELWTIIGGDHIPLLPSEFSTRVVDWLLAHPKP